ncbi:MAG: hypothetical protein HQK62_06490 [Desulfamplus sp.]|nr:hypothetical protein [Desulfamplus sp.]MBF0258474.1 hypothetical protein [Desulfamplus sp.]
MIPNSSNSQNIDISVQGKSHLIAKWIIIIVILLGELFLYTWCRVSYTETGFRISREKERQKILKAYTDALSMENDRLLSPERIAYIATTRLNLIIPETSQVIYMDM